jgi:hypothetical protein
MLFSPMLVAMVVFPMAAWGGSRLTLSETSFAFTGYQDQENPADALLILSNTGNAILGWNIYDANEVTVSLPDWLTIVPVSGTIAAGKSGYVIIQADIAGLSSGTHEYALEVVDAADPDIAHPLTISLEVIGPILDVSAGRIEFAFSDGDYDTTKRLTLKNTGGGVLNWSLTDPGLSSLTLPDWLTIDPLSGSLGYGGSDEISLSVNPASLSRGKHLFTFEIVDANGAQNSPKTVSVAIHIGGTIYVPGSYPTIQSAIDAAEPNAVIVVSPGTYAENIRFNGKNVALIAMRCFDPAVTAPTIIDGGGSGSVVTFTGSETALCVLRGFTLTHGYQFAAGGGILGNGTQAGIESCIITDNAASWGGGLCACNGAITHCLIVNNAAYYDGGGLAICDGEIKHCTIARNIAGDVGGGLFDCMATITNSIVWSNQAYDMPGIYAGQTPTYSCIQDGDGEGTGNLVSSPLFYDVINDDFHLKSQYGRWNPELMQWETDPTTSPCIDAGTPERINVWNSNGTPADPNDDYLEEVPDPNAGWSEELWPHGERVNMGVYGATAAASMSPSPVGNVANLNHDHVVDMSDFSIFCESWLLRRNLLDTDLDRDGDVDYADFALFSRQWLSPVELLLPPVPTGLTLVAGELEVTLDWDDSDYTYWGSYTIYRGINDADDLDLIASGVTDSTYVDSNLSDGTQYYYAVTIQSVFGSESDYSEVVFAEFAGPPAPTGFSVVVVDEDRVELDWDDSPYAYWDSYHLYRSTDPNNLKRIKSGLTGSAYVDEAVTGGTKYYYAVTTVSLYGSESAYSETVPAHPPYDIYDTFESGFGNWSNVTEVDHTDWIRNSGTTLSAQTGPASGAGGSTWYLYLECGYAPHAGDSAILQSPEINGIDRQLSFYYHMYGVEMGTLNVDVYSDGVWIEGVWSLSGQQQTSSTQAYTQATVDLSAYTGRITLRIRAVAAGGYRGDMAVDNIRISGVQ